jgi:outer membrane lipoprotein LolB
MIRSNVFAALLAGALLSACASLPQPPPLLQQQPVAPYREDIELSGRLSVNYQKDGQRASLAGRFVWQQSAGRTDVSLSSPLGQTVAMITVTPESAVLTQSGQAPQAAHDIDTLSARTLGWPLPVSGLRDWLQGYATSADGSRFVASPNRDRVTTRDGWRLHYVSWQDAAGARPGAAQPNAAEAGAPRAASPMPKRIDAERSADLQTDEVEIRLVLDAPEVP